MYTSANLKNKGRAHNFVNNYLYGMVWTQQTVIKFLKKKLADISYFEYPIPIQVFLEDINHTKHAHDRLKNICKCLAFGLTLCTGMYLRFSLTISPAIVLVEWSGLTKSHQEFKHLIPNIRSAVYTNTPNVQVLK